MMVTYMVIPTAESVGGWKELERVSLSDPSSDPLLCENFTSKPYYMLLSYPIFDDTNSKDLKFGVGTTTLDTGSNYSLRFSDNGGSDGTATSQDPPNVTLISSNNTLDNGFAVTFLDNNTNEDKLAISNCVSPSSTGAGNIPNRRDVVVKWANNSALMQTAQIYRPSYLMDTTSELVVLGYDPTDDNEGGFWEELASLSGDGTSASLDTGTFDAKKYLMFEIFLDDAVGFGMRVNGDDGNNYARRYTSNGTTHESNASIDKMAYFYDLAPAHVVGYISNPSGRESLMVFHTSETNDVTGAGTAPNRMEGVIKWADTDQINSVNIYKTATFSSACHMKIWGAD